MSILSSWQPLSLRLWRALWRDSTALDRAEHWMNMIEPRFRAERFHSLGAGDLLQLGGMTLVLLLLGPILLVALAVGGVLSGVVRGGLTAGMVSKLLANQRVTRRLDVLSITPGGVFQACWAMVVYYHLRKETQHPLASMVQGAQHVLTIIVGLGLVMLSAGGLLTLLAGGLPMLNTPAGQELVRGCMVTAGLLIALRYDTAISPLIGAAVGIWGGASTSHQLDGRLWALTVYIVIQASMLIGGGLVWLALTWALGLEFWAAYWLLVGLFLGLHEVVLRWVWWKACASLEISYSIVTNFKG